MQLKYSFRKEWSQFIRTFRFWGVLISVVGFALINLLMFKFTGMVLTGLEKSSDNSGVQGFAAAANISADVNGTAASESDQANSGGFGNDLLGDVDFSDMTAMYSDAGLMFSTTMTSFCSNSMLIIMIIMMSPSGGEQKKRAMIVPLSSGLRYKSYLLPKFVIYPLTIFAVTFISSLATGVACNALFPVNRQGAGMIMLASLMCAVYCLFIFSVYLSLGLCTSHPGFMTAAVYVGQSILQSLLIAMGLDGYNPFTLLTLCSGALLSADGFDLAANTPSIVCAFILSVAISVLMYFLALAVLKAKKIDNQAQEEPEF